MSLFDNLYPKDYNELSRADPLMGQFVTHTYKDLDQVEHWLEEMSFIPGSRLSAGMVHHQIQLLMTAPVFDSTSRLPVHVEHRVNWPHVGNDGSYAMTSDAMFGQVIMVATTSMLPSYLPEAGRESFLKVVREWLHDWMCHEADEWLKNRDTGKPFFDPHALQEVRLVGQPKG